jgi:2'-5' RNA ligase
VGKKVVHVAPRGFGPKGKPVKGKGPKKPGFGLPQRAPEVKLPRKLGYSKYPPMVEGASRLFIAFPLPGPLVDDIMTLKEYSEQVEKKLRDFKLHINFKFLGYIPQKLIPDIIDALGKIRFRPFEIELPSLHVYRFNKKKKELIIKVENSESYKSLKRDISLAMKSLGLPPNRSIHQVPVIPHIALIYPSRTCGNDLEDMVDKHNRHFGSVKVDHFHLYETKTTDSELSHVSLGVFQADPDATAGEEPPREAKGAPRAPRDTRDPKNSKDSKEERAPRA